MTDLPSQPYRVTALPTRKPMRFTFAPDAAGRAAIAAELGLLDLPELRLAGEIRQTERIAGGLAKRTFVLPWLPLAPVGVAALGALVTCRIPGDRMGA